MRAFFDFSTTPKANKINHPLEASMLPEGESVFDKQKTYIMCVPVAVYEAKMTQVNVSDDDEDITFILRRTGEDVYFSSAQPLAPQTSRHAVDEPKQ